MEDQSVEKYNIKILTNQYWFAAFCWNVRWSTFTPISTYDNFEITTRLFLLKDLALKVYKIKITPELKILLHSICIFVSWTPGPNHVWVKYGFNKIAPQVIFQMWQLNYWKKIYNDSVILKGCYLVNRVMWCDSIG